MSTELNIEFYNDRGEEDCEGTFVQVTHDGELTEDILNIVFDDVLRAFDESLSLHYYIEFFQSEDKDEDGDHLDPHTDYTFIELAEKLGRTDDIRKKVDNILQ